MKRCVIMMALVSAILTGCVVTSVSPYYTPNDLVTQPALLGDWTNAKNPVETWKFEQTNNLTYRLTLVEQSKTTLMEAHAFKLQGQLFLDIFSLEEDYHVIPAHYLLKVEQTAPYLKFRELDEAWLKSLLARDPAALRHHIIESAKHPSANRIVLTADTSELQSFLLAHLKTPQAWKDAFELRREIPTLKTAQTKGTL